jgi:hypothetical protein
MGTEVSKLLEQNKEYKKQLEELQKKPEQQ